MIQIFLMIFTVQNVWMNDFCLIEFKTFHGSALPMCFSFKEFYGSKNENFGK